MLHRTDLAATLARVDRPIEDATGLPSALYAEPESLAYERRALFNAGWAAAAFSHDAPGPGDVCPVDHLGQPLLLVRDAEGRLRVFENVCRHRGMILVDTAQRIEGPIRCPYHSWCYAHDGRLRATPHVGGAGVHAHAAIDPAATGLLEVPSGEAWGLVFVDLSGTAPAFGDWIAPLRTRWAEIADRPLFPGAESGFTLDVACNWKLAVENYCESYHLPFVHPALNSYSRLEDHYHVEAQGSFSGQGTRVYAPDLGAEAPFPDFEGITAEWDRTAEYVALYPNALLGVHRDHTFAILLAPRAHDRTEERVEIFYTTEAAATGSAFAPARRRNAALWKAVFEEDVFVVEGMQKGRGAPGFDGGRFSPVMDGPTHAFHAWVAARLAG